jgi:hypothetical protein
MRDLDSAVCIYSLVLACCLPNIGVDEAEHWGALFAGSDLSAGEILPAIGKISALRSKKRLRTLVHQYKLESDSHSDVTGNDASVKVNDTLDGDQAATMVVKAEAMCAGSCLLRDCRSDDGRRTLRRHSAKYISAPPEPRSD